MDVRTQMRSAAGYYAAREAVVMGERRLSFAQAWERGVRMANGLLSLGLKPQDRVGVLEDNRLESSDIFLGAGIANLVRVPLYPRNAPDSHVHMMGHTNCRALVVDEKYLHEIEPIRAQLPELQHIVVRDAAYESWLARQSAVDPDPPIDENDNYIIRHTGGTTGRPKGVAYSHRAWLAAGRDWFYLFPPVAPDDACLHIGPISHASGYQFLPVWMGGGRNIMVDRFDPAEVLDLMERERIAYLFMVPTMLNAVNRQPGLDRRDFSYLKCMLVAAAPIADDTALAAKKYFGHAMYQGYGQTEVLPISMMGPKQWFASDLPGSTPLRSCGLPLPFIQVQIWDEDNKPVPAGTVGEIVGKADGQMTGFWNNPQATAERMVDGWVKTGDVGYLDANGYLYMVDRAGDMIVSGGFNIYPAELENALCDHPDVVEAAVFGIPHDRWGETPCAVCTVRPNATVSEAELIALCEEKLGNYKRPGKVVLRADPLPKTPVGKIKRKELREPFWAGHTRRISGRERMRWLRCAIIALVPSFVPLGAYAQSPDALRIVFEAWMKEHGVEKGVFVARGHDGASTVEHGYGGQDPKQRVLLASLGKAITGQCVGELIAAGRLRFETTVGEALRPFFAKHGEPADARIKDATVAQLLEHRAGFAAAPRDLMTPAAMELLQKSKSPSTATLQELLAATLTVPLQSAPGEAFRYSNIGYLVLGATIEVTTGEDYERFCARTVLQSAGVADGALDPEWRTFSSFGGWRLSGAEYLRAMAPRRFPACRESMVTGRDPAPSPVEDWNEQERCERPMLGTMPPGPDDPAPFYWLGRNAALVRREVNVTSNDALHLRRWYRYWHTGSWGVGTNTIGMIAVEHESGLSWFVWFTPRPPQAARDRLFDALLDAAKDK